MKRTTWFWSAGAAASLALLAAWAFAPRPVEVELASARVGRFEQAVEEDGKTRLTDRYVVCAPLAGRLSRISLREGDEVSSGATVALLAPSLPSMLDERDRSQLRARLEAAEAAVEVAVARQRAAGVLLSRARSDIARSEQLAGQGFISPSRLESDRLAVDAALREEETAVAARHVAVHEAEQARAVLSLLQRPIGAAGEQRFAVTSPISGQVLRVSQGSETSVVPGTPLLEVGDVGRLEIVVELLTADALAARVGSEAWIERWGGPQPLRGQVSRVEPSAFTKVSALGVEEQRVRVLINLTSPREQWQRLGDGFRVGVRIVTSAQEQALQVPVSAVFPLPSQGEGDTPGYAVFVAQAGHARLVPVSLAARNGASAWLREGLAAGARVIVYPGAELADGARIRERKV